LVLGCLLWTLLLLPLQLVALQQQQPLAAPAPVLTHPRR